MHLTPSRSSPLPPRLTMPPPSLLHSKFQEFTYLGDGLRIPRRWLRGGGEGADNLRGISSGWEFNEPLDGRLIFLYSLDIVLLHCRHSCVGFLWVRVKECTIHLQLFLFFLFYFRIRIKSLRFIQVLSFFFQLDIFL